MGGADGVAGGAVREEKVVAHPDRGREVANPRRVDADPVTCEGDDLGFIQRHPVVHPVAEPSRDDLRVSAERGHGVGGGPSAPVL